MVGAAGFTVVMPEQVLPMAAVCAGPAEPALIPYEVAAVVPVPAMAGE